MMMSLWTVLLVFATVTAAYEGDKIDGTGCPKAFQGRCSCGNSTYANWNNGNDVYMVNCTNTRFNTTDMLELLPTETQVLLFNGNNIPSLDWNVFGVWDDHKALEVVDLSNNQITDILGKSFHKVRSVKRLVLDHNNLKITGRHHHPRLLTNFLSLEELHLTNAFTEVIDSKWYLEDLRDIFLSGGTDKLWKLHLEQNEIWSITDNTFCDLPALQDLYLGDNQLTDIDFNIKCIKKLRMLDLQRNKIKRLDSKALSQIDEKARNIHNPSGFKINLNWNPWDCDCYLKPFVDWVKRTSTKLYREINLTCYTGYPEVNAGRRIKRLDANNDLWCGGDPHGPTHALLTILIVSAMACLVVLLGWVNRARLRKMGPALADSFSQRMQYSTIKNAFNDGPNDHLPENNHTVTYTLSNSNALGSSHRIGLTPSSLPPEVHVWVNPISNSLVGGAPSPRPHSRSSSQSSGERGLCQGSLGDCHCTKCNDGFYWG